MEDFEKIKRFLSIGDGSGYGYGIGIGDGYGYGYGDGSGSSSGSVIGHGNGSGSVIDHGDGSGNGSGSVIGHGAGSGYGSGSVIGINIGSGSGSGDGNGIKEYDGKPVYIIDNVPTILTNVHGNIAEGYVVREDLSLHPCFVARSGDFFSHGVTSREALLDARAKYEHALPEEERIKLFMEEYPSLDSVAACSDLFRWHHTLTGSCTTGRKEFVAAHGIDVEKDSMTVANFIRLTENAYGGNTIKELKEMYETRKTQEQ